jgi:hypothetical protein
LSIDATQFTGIACFSAVAVLAAWASTIVGSRKLWLSLTVFYATLVLEVTFSNRHGLTNLMRVFLKQRDFFSVKVSVQMGLLFGLVLTLVCVVLALFVALRRYGIPERVACIVSVVLSCIFIVEVISLHATDAILYRSIYGVLAIGYLWGVCASLTGLAAIARVRQRSLPK